MVQFVIIFIIIILGFILSSNRININYDVKRKLHIQLIAVILIFISGLRHVFVGPDTYQYYLRFEEVKYNSWANIIQTITNNEDKDPFYGLFQKCFQLISENYQVYLCFVALIFMTALGRFIYKNTDRISHSIIALIIYMGYYYGFYSITGIRQTLATALLLFSFEYGKQKNLTFFTLLVITASLFHITALVFFPLYFIVDFKKSKLLITLSLIGFPLFFVFKNDLAIFFIKILKTENRFGEYAEQYYRGGSLAITAFHLLLALIGQIQYKKVIMIEPKASMYYNIFSLAIFFLPLQWVNPSAGRISQYFAIFMMVWIPYILDSTFLIVKNYRLTIYIITIVLFIFFTMFSVRAMPEYHFFWENMNNPYINNFN